MYSTNPRVHNRSTNLLPPIPTSRSYNDLARVSVNDSVVESTSIFERESDGRTVTNVDLYRLLRKINHVNPDEFIDVLRKLTKGMERHTADYSMRFQMLVLPWNASLIWFTCIDGLPFVFALSECVLDNKLNIKYKDKTESIPCITIPSCGTAWTALQRRLVKRFDCDDHVRAVLIASMVSFAYSGKFTCVLDSLCPIDVRKFTPAIDFDVPVDQDILTCLADPYLCENNNLFFDCNGVCAKVTHFHQDSIYHLVRTKPPESRKPFQEKSDLLMPYLYGFGELINGSISDYSRTSETSVLINRLIKIGRKHYVYDILKMVVFASPRRQLDLTEAANMISKWEGGILPGTWGRNPWERRRDGIRGSIQRATKYIRRITGDVIVIGKDGLYKSSRYNGTEVEGGMEIDLALFKFGLKAKREIYEEDRKITHLSQVASYILGQEYVPLDNCNGDMVMVPDSNDMWNDEIAIANTLAALICRRFGMFEGFSSFASSPRYLAPLSRTNMVPHMEADIYLPVLHVFVDPPRQLQMIRSGFMLTLLIFSICTLVALLLRFPILAALYITAYAVTLFFAAFNLGDLEENFYRSCLQRLSLWVIPLQRNVGNEKGRWTILIHDNPFVPSQQDGRVRVFGHVSSYIDFRVFPFFR